MNRSPSTGRDNLQDFLCWCSFWAAETFAEAQNETPKELIQTTNKAQQDYRQTVALDRKL